MFGRPEDPKVLRLRSLYYYGDINRMTDENGDVFNDIFRIVSPAQYNMYRDTGGTYYHKDPEDRSTVYEMNFPIEDDAWEEYWEGFKVN